MLRCPVIQKRQTPNQTTNSRPASPDRAGASEHTAGRAIISEVDMATKQQTAQPGAISRALDAAQVMACYATAHHSGTMSRLGGDWSFDLLRPALAELAAKDKALEAADKIARLDEGSWTGDEMSALIVAYRVARAALRNE